MQPHHAQLTQVGTSDGGTERRTVVVAGTHIIGNKVSRALGLV